MRFKQTFHSTLIAIYLRYSLQMSSAKCKSEKIPMLLQLLRKINPDKDCLTKAFRRMTNDRDASTSRFGSMPKMRASNCAKGHSII